MGNGQTYSDHAGQLAFRFSLTLMLRKLFTYLLVLKEAIPLPLSPVTHEEWPRPGHWLGFVPFGTFNLTAGWQEGYQTCKKTPFH